MRLFRFLIRFGWGFAALIAMAGLVACGGGGDSGGGLTYTGFETPAIITQDNAGQLTTDAYNGGDISETLGGAFSAVKVETDEEISSAPRPLVIAALVDQIFSQAKVKQMASDAQAASLSIPAQTIPGPCGGSAEMSINVNDISLDMSGSFRFNSYCDDGVVINGLASLSGIDFDLTNESFGQMTMSFPALAVTGHGDDFTMSGDVVVNSGNSNTQSMVMNLVMQDNLSGQMVKMQDYNLTLSEEETYTRATMNGRFFDSEQGYVDLAGSNLVVDHNAEWPRDGVIRVTGDNGCNAVLTALDGATYRLEVDEDGDKQFEHTEQGRWSDL